MYRAAGLTDVGSVRIVNEDRFLSDPSRGIFVVVDGVGGQAAGGRAADTALETIRTRLASSYGPLPARIREAITRANNEVLRQAGTRAEWQGMACVLTMAAIENGRAVIGHVGDTRLYKLRGGAIEKITADHSPVGEREDAGELPEAEAMRHPRRNEVYRDVGSEPHDETDPGFVEIREISWEPDAALLLCSDGLSDLVSSDEIRRLVERYAGDPQKVANALVKAANDAGGKDNVTVVYVEGEQFARARPRGPRRSGRLLVHLTIWLIAIAGLGVAWRSAGYPLPDLVAQAFGTVPPNVLVVSRNRSIAAALAAAKPGVTIMVEPGEYRERLTLKHGVRLVSLVPRGAVLRLPGTATEEDAAVIATDIADAEIAGFRIVGDAATPLGTGVLVRSASVRLIDLEVTGAARSAIDLGVGSVVMLLASDIHDNPGAGLALRARNTARVSHNAFYANGSSPQAVGALIVEPGAQPKLDNNVFRNLDPQSLTFLDAPARAEWRKLNVFPDAPAQPSAATPHGRGRGR